VPALPPYLIEPIWQQFAALLPEREINPPLGCHRSRIPERVVFEKLVQVLVFGCAYERIADGTCSATTLRDRDATSGSSWGRWMPCGRSWPSKPTTIASSGWTWRMWLWTAASQRPLAVARRKAEAR